MLCVRASSFEISFYEYALIYGLINSNADLIFLKQGLTYLIRSLGILISRLSAFAAQYRALPTLGFTHFQSAQLTTVGKRATLWIQVGATHNMGATIANEVHRSFCGT